jgi:site-specific DNA-methyltransferase (adenine-specific)
MSNIKLYQGDCLEIMPSIPDKSIDMILCDLPYGTTACKWDVIIPFEPLWKEYKRIIKDRGCIALFGSEPFSSYLRISNIKDYKYDWIWNKDKGGNPLSAKFNPMKSHENISIFSITSTNYYPIMQKRDIDKKGENYKNQSIDTCFNTSIYDNSDKVYTHYYPKSIINISSASKECNNFIRIHPTQKPIALLEYLIKTYTLKNESVLDNCMGSGSTGVACIKTGRNFIGIEKDEKYFKIAEDRINKEKLGIFHRNKE